MRICIHRGTKDIGGTCVEIESQGMWTDLGGTARMVGICG
jgi:hypothetical protein